MNVKLDVVFVKIVVSGHEILRRFLRDQTIGDIKNFVDTRKLEETSLHVTDFLMG